MLKRDNIANLLNQQILLEELEKKEGKKIEEENNKSKILIFVEFIGLILEFIFCFFQPRALFCAGCMQGAGKF